jgi:hypothetical protein
MTIQVSSALKRNFLKINDQTSIYFCFIQFLLLCLHSQNPTPIRLSYVVFMFISSPLHISITFFSLLSPIVLVYPPFFFRPFIPDALIAMLHSSLKTKLCVTRRKHTIDKPRPSLPFCLTFFLQPLFPCLEIQLKLLVVDGLKAQT